MGERHCTTCKYSERDSLLMPCAQCVEIKGEFAYWEPKESPIMYDKTLSKNISMIKSIIDEAMEKKDRSVSVFIHNGSINITVTPIGADEPRWIKKDEEKYGLGPRWACSVCGSFTDWASRYCPNCGEALKVVEKEFEPEIPEKGENEDGETV